MGKIVQLIKNSKHQKIFADKVLRFFFEMSLWNAKYGFFKKNILTALLTSKINYGTLYFNIAWKTQWAKKDNSVGN